MSNNPQYHSDDGILTKQTNIEVCVQLPLSTFSPTASKLTEINLRVCWRTERASLQQQHMLNILDPSNGCDVCNHKKNQKTKNKGPKVNRLVQKTRRWSLKFVRHN